MKDIYIERDPKDKIHVNKGDVFLVKQNKPTKTGWEQLWEVHVSPEDYFNYPTYIMIKTPSKYISAEHIYLGEEKINKALTSYQRFMNQHIKLLEDKLKELGYEPPFNPYI